MRYVNLSSLLILRAVSTAVCKRFPTLEHLVEAGELPGPAVPARTLPGRPTDASVCPRRQVS